MKKSLSIIAGLFALLAVSCTQEKLDTLSAGEEVTVSFSAALPEAIATKAYSDGKTATKLHYGVYVAGQTTPKFQNTEDFNNLQATVELTLATGVSYDLVFWAESANDENDAATNPYTIDWTTKTMTVDYEAINANDENNDAFYAYVPALRVDGALNKTVELRRPFAQINLGTNDYDAAAAAGLDVDRTDMVVTGLPNVLNLVSGEVECTDPNKVVRFKVNEIGKTETYPVAGYTYLEMNYVLAGTQKATKNLAFNVYQTGMNGALEPNITVTNVPVQRNYRTNIYGALLTDPADITVNIVPGFADADNDGVEDEDYNVPADVAAIYDAAKNGGSIALESDLVLDEPLVIENDLTINLNGKTIKYNKTSDKNIDFQLFRVFGNKLTIEGTGQISSSYFTFRVDEGGELNLKGNVDYYGNISVVQLADGTANISAGRFDMISGGYETLGSRSYYMLNCIDSYYNNGKAIFNVTGGTFVGFNPKNNKSEGEGTNFVAEGYESVLVEGTEDTYEVKVAAGDAVVTITTAAELAAMLSAFSEAGAGNNTIEIDANVELAEGEDWTPLHINGYSGAGTITIDGKGHYISGLNGALLKSGFAGNSGVVVKNLTIKNSVIGKDKEYYVEGAPSNGVFFCYCDSMEELTFINCHIDNVQVTGSKYVAGFVGYTAGHADVITDVKIEGCTVKNCTFTTEGDDSIGGLIAHSGGSTYTPTYISNCTVSGCTFAQSSLRTDKIGYAIGTVGIASSTELTSSVTGNGNSYMDNGVKKNLENIVGRFVPSESGATLKIGEKTYTSGQTNILK